MRGKLKDRDLPTRTQGYGVCCPNCQGPLMLNLMRDGDQAYWCHRCEKGFRIGELPVDGVVILAPKQNTAQLISDPKITPPVEQTPPEPPQHLPSPSSPTAEHALSDQPRKAKQVRNSLGRKSRA